jgi:hypothetical protein
LHKDAPEAHVNLFDDLSLGFWMLTPFRSDIQLTEHHNPLYCAVCGSEGAKFMPGCPPYWTSLSVSATDYSADWEGQIDVFWRNSIFPAHLRVLVQGPQRVESYVLPIVKESLTDNASVSQAVPDADGGLTFLVHSKDADHLMRFDQAGQKSWEKEFALVQGSYKRLNSVGPSGCLFSHGLYFEDGTHVLLDATLLDLRGNIVWTKTSEIPGPVYSAAGGPDFVMISSMPSDATDNACILQRFGADGQEDWRLPLNGFTRAVCVDKDGATIAFEDVGTNVNICVVTADGQLAQRNALPHGYPDIYRQAFVAEDGRIAVAGSTNEKALPSEIFMIVEQDGTLVWRKDFGTDETHALESFTPCADGGYLLVGTARLEKVGSFARSSYVKFLLKIGPQGETQWYRNAEGGNIDAVTQTPDGGYLLGGRIDDQYWLYKTDAQGHSLVDID